MKLYIPENLDIYELVHNNPPKFKPFKIDKLCYILHLINALPITNEDLTYERFVPLNSTKLQGKIQNYLNYLKYLESELNVIESDHQYIVGEKSKGFTFLSKYKTVVKPIQVADFSFRKTLKHDANRKSLSVTNLNYITKWFNEKLEIDFEFLKSFLKEELDLKTNNKEIRDYNRSKKKYKNPIYQYNCTLICGDKMNRREYNLSQDYNVYRFHSNLTNMRSIARNAVTYNGQNLISIDIRNSQPYLSTILFNPSFWKKRKNIEESKEEESKRGENKINIYASNNYNLNIKQLSFNYMNSYIMLGDILESIDSRGFNEYIKLVINGKIYEYMEKQYTTKLGETFSSRKEIKTVIFQVLFTDNRFIGQDDAKPKKLFKELFPEVYEVFKRIKSKDKTLLPRLLQRIESYLIIEVICKRISEEYPNVPIFTIHDSISTTEEYVDIVNNIMTEELSKAIGHPPTLVKEKWCKSNIENYINLLRNNAKKAA